MPIKQLDGYVAPSAPRKKGAQCNSAQRNTTQNKRVTHTHLVGVAESIFESPPPTAGQGQNAKTAQNKMRAHLVCIVVEALLEPPHPLLVLDSLERFSLRPRLAPCRLLAGAAPAVGVIAASSFAPATFSRGARTYAYTGESQKCW